MDLKNKYTKGQNRGMSLNGQSKNTDKNNYKVKKYGDKMSIELKNDTEEELVMKNICDTQFDKKLLKNDFLVTHEYLLPFIGENYEKTRILQVGESHYVDMDSIADEVKRNNFLEMFNNNWWDTDAISENMRQELLSEEMARTKGSPTKFIWWVNTRDILYDLYERITKHRLKSKSRIYTAFASAYFGDKTDDEIVSNYTNFAYFNFFQKPSIIKGKSIKRNYDYSNTRKNAIPTARHIIEAIEPKVIVFTSSLAYDAFFLDAESKKYKGISIRLPHPVSSWWFKKNASESLRRFLIENGYSLSSNRD